MPTDTGVAGIDLHNGFEITRGQRKRGYGGTVWRRSNRAQTANPGLSSGDDFAIAFDAAPDGIEEVPRGHVFSHPLQQQGACGRVIRWLKASHARSQS